MKKDPFEDLKKEVVEAIDNMRFMSCSPDQINVYGSDRKLIEDAKHFAVEKWIPKAGYVFQPIGKKDRIIIIHTSGEKAND